MSKLIPELTREFKIGVIVAMHLEDAPAEHIAFIETLWEISEEEVGPYWLQMMGELKKLHRKANDLMRPKH